MNSEELRARTKLFALEIIKLIESLPRTNTGDVLARQVLRPATSIGANYRAACRARSRADFISTIAIAEEESDESQYGLELIAESQLVPKQNLLSLLKEANELTAILTSSGKTTERNKYVAVIILESKIPNSKSQIRHPKSS